MPPKGYFIDANLLVLFVAGSVNRDIIRRHRRLRDDYTAADYDRLMDLFNEVDQLLVMPNTLTEASNLLAQHGEPERSRLLAGLRVVIEESEEVVVASGDAAATHAFIRHGLTDAALLRAVSEEAPLLTADEPLYRDALASGREIAVNFAAVREWAG